MRFPPVLCAPHTRTVLGDGTVGARSGREQSCVVLLVILSPAHAARCDGNSVRRGSNRRRSLRGWRLQDRDGAPRAAATTVLPRALQEGGLQLVLEGHDGTGFERERGFEMRDGLFRLLTRPRQFGRGAALGKCGAHVALAGDKPFPEPIRGRDAEVNVQPSQGFGLVAEADHEQHKAPECASAEAQALEFVGGVDAEGMSAAVVARLPIVAEDPPPATRSPAIIVLDVTVELPVKDQCPGCLAVRTRRQFQVLAYAKEIIFGPVEPRERQAQSIPSATAKARIIPASEILPLRDPASAGGVNGAGEVCGVR